jgi:hypothetical protein
MDKMSISKLLSDLQDKYYALSRREQITVVVGSLAVGFFLLFQLVLLPTHDRLNRLGISIKNKERALAELNTVVAQYKTISTDRQDGGKTRGETFSLFSVLEKFATESGLTEKIEYMRPGTQQIDPLREERWVEIKLGRVTLKEFTEYLGKIHSFGGGIYIKRLSARKDGDYLSLILQPAIAEAK